MRIKTRKSTAIVAPSADFSCGVGDLAFESTRSSETVACPGGEAVKDLCSSSQGMSPAAIAFVPEIMIEETFALNIVPSEI
ncbi:hypothetical protein DPMN_194874 [Dreissena polymorpha]|uniref:Uncharacterized protein n=1 Tax=Dreissena polymorpha TaxID=45954 RepID=A0A9D3XXM5_DREPO|nr:hypothetical protein DPMN_194874 [Dreissena polymorpha]